MMGDIQQRERTSGHGTHLDHRSIPRNRPGDRGRARRERSRGDRNRSRRLVAGRRPGRPAAESRCNRPGVGRRGDRPRGTRRRPGEQCRGDGPGPGRDRSGGRGAAHHRGEHARRASGRAGRAAGDAGAGLRPDRLHLEHSRAAGPPADRGVRGQQVGARGAGRDPGRRIGPLRHLGSRAPARGGGVRRCRARAGLHRRHEPLPAAARQDRGLPGRADHRRGSRTTPWPRPWTRQARRHSGSRSAKRRRASWPPAKPRPRTRRSWPHRSTGNRPPSPRCEHPGDRLHGYRPALPSSSRVA